MSLGKAARTLIKPARGALGSFSAPTRAYAAVAEARAVLEKELDGIRAAGTWKAERIITSMQGPQINVDSSRSGEYWNCGEISFYTNLTRRFVVRPANVKPSCHFGPKKTDT